MIDTGLARHSADEGAVLLSQVVLLVVERDRWLRNAFALTGWFFLISTDQGIHPGYPVQREVLFQRSGDRTEQRALYRGHDIFQHMITYIRPVIFRRARRAFRNLRVTESLRLQGNLLPLSYCAVFRVSQIAPGLAGGASFSPSPTGKPIFP